MRRMNARVVVAWLILACGAAASADHPAWMAGQQSFQSGDYASALRHFQAARADGLDSPAVHYNIAVCQFKLTQWDSARDSFRQIGQRFPQMEGLAEYNLGLVARRVGDDEAARAHFLRAYQLSPDDRTLRVLASNRLRKLAPSHRVGSRWTGALGMRAGYDDNVVLRDDTGLPQGTTTESPVVDVFLSAEGDLTPGGAGIEASLYLIRNLDADEFDQTELLGGATYRWEYGPWRAKAGAHVSTATLGGDAFDRKAGISAYLRRAIGQNAHLNLSLRYDDVDDADPLFAGIAGTRQQLRALYRWSSGRHRVTLRYVHESNDRDDPGVSPVRNGIGGVYGYSAESGWRYEGGLRIRSSDYDDLPLSRTEDLLGVEFTLTRSLGADWLALLEVRFADNDSSDPAFSYRRTQVSVGAIRSF